MATLKNLEDVIATMTVDELTNLFATATIETKRKEIAQLIASRDAATREADVLIAQAQAELVDIQTGKATVIAVTP